MNRNSTNNTNKNTTNELDNEYTEFNSYEYNPYQQFTNDNFEDDNDSEDDSVYYQYAYAYNNNTDWHQSNLSENDKKTQKSLYHCGIWSTIFWAIGLGLILCSIIFTVNIPSSLYIVVTCWVSTIVCANHNSTVLLIGNPHPKRL